MAVIRCPHCGKPNPDVVDVCQYCEQPLRDANEPPPASSEPIRKSLIIHCPNCGKPNPEFLTVCQYCDALLKPATGPLATRPPASAAEPEAEAEPAGDLPDWLRALRGEGTAGGPGEAPFTPPASEVTHDWEWTGTAEPSPGQEATPASEGDIPDWLKSLHGGEAGPPAAEPEETQPAATPSPEGDIPDWLKSMGTSPAEAGAAADQELPDWLKSATGPLGAATPLEAEPGAAGQELPDWLKSATGPLGSAAPAAPPPPGGGESSAFVAEPGQEGAEAGETPDWLRDLGQGEPAPTPAPAVTPTAPLPAILPGPQDEPDFLNNLRGAAEPVIEEEQPDWLKSLGLPAAASAPPGAPALDFSAPAPEEEPDWMRALRSEAPAPEAEAELAPAESEPDWLAALRAESPAAAEAAGEAVSPFAAEMSAPAPAPGSEPDWLAALRPSAPTPTPERPPSYAPDVQLAQGELPNWLAAMRPVEVERAAIEPEMDDYQEAVGILAGMRGVLRAEPSVVLPGKSATNVHALAFTPDQAKQAEKLAALLLSDREAALVAKHRARLAIPWERWLVAVVILAGVLMPHFLLPGLFPLPVKTPLETAAAFNAIEALPADRPVLVAFDFEPAQAGELGPLADALVGHLVLRGLPIVAISTSPTGAGVAQEALTQLTLRNTYTETVTHLNLGYLPGGPVGILQFTLAPRSLMLSDFRGESYLEQGGPWSLPVLRAVDTLNSFGAAVILSATPEDARAWIEQTQDQPTPLVLAVSAGAAPLVRPYYEAEQSAAALEQRAPRIRGFVSGAAGAMQYQAQAGVYVNVAPEPVMIRWEMLGGGLLTIAFLLGLGNLVHGALQALRRSPARRKGKA